MVIDISAVMKKKLTLTIEEAVKERAKKFAKYHNTSVSEIVEKYLDAVTHEEESGFTPESGSWVESMFGSVKFPKEYERMSYKQIKEKEVFKKHG